MLVDQEEKRAMLGERVSVSKWDEEKEAGAIYELIHLETERYEIVQKIRAMEEAHMNISERIKEAAGQLSVHGQEGRRVAHNGYLYQTLNGVEVHRLDTLTNGR
jgi:hypothetical protein